MRPIFPADSSPEHHRPDSGRAETAAPETRDPKPEEPDSSTLDQTAGAERHGERGLLLLDPSPGVRQRLGAALAGRGFLVHPAESVEAALAVSARQRLAFAVLELELGRDSARDLLLRLRRTHPGLRAVIHSNHGDVRSAAAMIRAGAVDFLIKGLPAAEIEAALVNSDHPLPPLSAEPVPDPEAVRRTHIAHILEATDHNVSETARRLRMHRRTLQRILGRDGEAALPAAE